MTTILVVDDDSHIRRVIRRFLEAKGYKVLEAVEGVAALAVLEKHVVALVITDLMMPGMDGLELVRRMRRDLPRLRAVVISAMDEIIDLAEREPNVIGTLKKPFELTELGEAVRAVVEETSQ